jgi:RpiB/LacA/LacB family sugar-phosphate isomerase
VAILAIGSDHAGFRVKEYLKVFLSERGHEVRDMGCARPDPIDYPLPAYAVGEAVACGDADRGILVCGTGIGMSIAANKVKGVRAALVHDRYTAAMARKHNDANVLCMGGRLMADLFASDVVDTWLSAEFEERHRPRLDQITRVEEGVEPGG